MGVKRKIKLALIAVLAAALAISVAANLSAFDDEPSVQEKIESLTGRPIPDWAAYQGKIQSACDRSYNTLGQIVFGVANASNDSLEAAVISLREICPDRYSEIQDGLYLADENWVPIAH